MTTETQSQSDNRHRVRHLLTRFGTGVLVFYTIKGILWLVVPAALIWWSNNH